MNGHSSAKVGTPWKCQGCGTLLGIERGGEVHLRYKDFNAIVCGRVRATCRRCARPNVLHPAPRSDVAS